ncbi:MAG: DUF559 domain-containing protein [Jatrophihabitans sp.]
MQYLPWMAIARRQAGVISRQQCLSSGLSAAQVNGLMKRGALVRLECGVLRVAGAPVRADTILWRAVLATRGILMGPAAGYLWQLLPECPDPLEILIDPGRRIAIPSGVRIRRLAYEDHEWTYRYRLPVTGRARTVLDCVAFGNASDAMALVDRALSRGWITMRDLERRLDRPVAGNNAIRRVLAGQLSGAEAESERRLHRLLQRGGITGWVGNHRVVCQGRVMARVDVAFVKLRLAIEVDGFAYHSDRQRFQHDRRRQNTLVGLGWTVLRFTWHDIVEQPERVLATIRRQIAILERTHA